MLLLSYRGGSHHNTDGGYCQGHGAEKLESQRKEPRDPNIRAAGRGEVGKEMQPGENQRWATRWRLEGKVFQQAGDPSAVFHLWVGEDRDKI